MVAANASHYTYRTPHGPITIGVRDGAVCVVKLGEERLAGERKPTELANRCATELLEYFAGRRRAFDVPLSPEGTSFQRDVWRAIQTIPYGQTLTNAEVAQAAGHPGACRLVGSAVRKNPVAILIPAHRVVGANGRTTGSDKRSQLRAAFLELERRHVQA